MPFTVEPVVDGYEPLYQAGYEAPQYPVAGGIVAKRVPAPYTNRYQPVGKYELLSGRQLVQPVKVVRRVGSEFV
mgnify:CR=1 FL=1